MGSPADAAVLGFLLQLALLLGAARLGGGVARRMGQPAVLGELVAGVALGPSVAGALLPTGVGAWILPDGAPGPLATIGTLGALFLLLVTGLETDLRLLRANARRAVTLSGFGVGLTFLLGVGLGWVIPDSLLGDPGQRAVFALFLASALSITAIPVLARILLDLGLLRRDLGQVLLATGICDDLLGWTLLGTVVGLVGQEGSAVAALGTSLLRVGVFLAVGVFVVGWLVRRGLGLMPGQGGPEGGLMTFAVVWMLLGSALSHALHLEPVIGAFLIGILLGQSRALPTETVRRLEEVALAIFAPVFFGLAGTHVDLRALASPTVVLVSVAVVAVASVGKVGGAYLAGRILGADRWTSLAYGAGLNARGALEIVVATVGLRLGILSPALYSAIVLMALATSLMTPAALRWIAPRLPVSEDEQRRLGREELDRVGSLGRIRRVLVPLRVRPGGGTPGWRLQESLLSTLDAHVTLLAVVPPAERRSGIRFLESHRVALGDLRPQVKEIESERVAEPILAEARSGYDLLLLGAPEPGTGSTVLFNPLVDYLTGAAPCPTVIVRPGRGPYQDRAPTRILVPTNGTQASRRAAEIAFRWAWKHHADVTVLTVVPDQQLPVGHLGRRRAQRRSDRQAGGGIVASLTEAASAVGVRASGIVRRGSDIARTVLDTVEAGGHDLVILGTVLRLGSDHLFLGPTVEEILEASAVDVIIVNS